MIMFCQAVGVSVTFCVWRVYLSLPYPVGTTATYPRPPARCSSTNILYTDYRLHLAIPDGESATLHLSQLPLGGPLPAATPPQQPAPPSGLWARISSWLHTLTTFIAR